jgi:calreticulin
MKALLLLGLLFFAAIAQAEVYFSEEFTDGWEQRWVLSQNKPEGERGAFEVTAGKYYGDAEADKGLKTTQDARFYQISAEFPEFSNKGKTLVLQYSVKHEQNIDCGGGYVKLFPAGLNPEDLNGDSVYNIMFGPDICGTTRRTHVIFNYKGKNYLRKNDLRTESNEYTHVYTLIVNPNNTYTVLIDNSQIGHGSLLEDFGILPPKEINDPEQSKPADWVDTKTIADPEAVKPEGWDEIPKTIQDPNAARPDDWDDELDGEWEAPEVPNPEYKGPWVAPQIPNPEYKGEWVHPKVPNPEYVEDNEIYAYESNKHLAVEIWQVKSGSIFDRFLLTDDVDLAHEWAEKSIAQNKAENEAKKAEQEKKQKEEEEARANAPEQSEEADDDEVDDDDEDEKEIEVESAHDGHEGHDHDEL